MRAWKCEDVERAIGEVRAETPHDSARDALDELLDRLGTLKLYKVATIKPDIVETLEIRRT